MEDTMQRVMQSTVVSQHCPAAGTRGCPGGARARPMGLVILMAAACAALAGCDSTSGSQNKKTSIRGTATFQKAEFQKGEKLE